MKQISTLIAMILSGVIAQNDKYTDENRPYKFAFNIEGYQHRSEEKNEKGIIMGEYGFVTGDGVYHVTVYATDENGNFKILSMKNYFIGLPTDGPSTQPAPTTPPKPIKNTRKINTNSPTLKTSTPSIRTTQGGIMGCGGCRIPTTSSKPDPGFDDLDDNIDVRFGKGKVQEKNPSSSSTTLRTQISDVNTPRMNILSNKQSTNYKSNPKFQSVTPSSQGVKSVSSYMKSITTTQRGVTSIDPITRKSNSNVRESSQGLPVKSTNSLKTNSKDDKEIPKKSLSNLLYEFNQTQSFQGQFEQGFVDSSKTGDYFVNDRNGVKRIVEYVANENGFQPQVKFEKITGSEVPIPETEKEQNVLKEMYFKWFYGGQ